MQGAFSALVLAALDPGLDGFQADIAQREVAPFGSQLTSEFAAHAGARTGDDGKSVSIVPCG